MNLGNMWIQQDAAIYHTPWETIAGWRFSGHIISGCYDCANFF